MDSYTTELQTRLDGLLAGLREELLAIRTGKPSPALIENLNVKTYGGQTELKLKECASIVTEGPNGLHISPFDPSTTQDIEKAILSSPLGLTPRVDGKDIHLTVPALSEEQRLKMTRLISTLVEEFKQKMRVYRDEARKKVKTAFENKDIAEDEKYRWEKAIDDTASSHSLKIDELKVKKTSEITHI
jgi:ribosome recycling factor